MNRIQHLVMDDDTPVDGFLSEKQMRLLAGALFTSWDGPGGGRPFLVSANVGLFNSPSEPPLVPDVMLSLDVRLGDLDQKANRSYFIWIMGKPPEVAIEIVSNREGNETSTKMHDYARFGVKYYVIFDPLLLLQPMPLRIFELLQGSYVEMPGHWLPGVELGLVLWKGQFEGMEETWLRWTGRDGNLIATGEERAERAEQQAKYSTAEKT